MANHSEMSAPPLRECDIVLKGGIASGVIYPRLITTLAKVYKLRSFGGTSAGAIAAAAGAAAQVGKLTGGNSAAFDSLEQLPNLLATISPGDSGSVLFHLFQPQPKLARLFALLAAGLNAPSAGRRVSSIAVAAIRNFPLGAIVGAAPGVVTLIYSWHIGAVLAAAFALIGALVGAAVAALLSLGRHLPGNYFGLCNGMPGVPRSHSSHAALTPWLHQYLNELAGKRAEDPLTFGELWSGRLRINSTPWDAPSPHAPRAVDLAMITTALNLGRPLRLPLESEDFYFVREEIDKLFPPAVVAWLVEYARPSKTAQSLRIDGTTYYALPAAADFPLIVAVRMSLSFPLLLSAVPLYVVDRTLQANATQATVATRVYFSDGGICSNFPIEFFDSPLPTRPTFGVDLRDFHPDHPGQRVWMPGSMENRQGIQTYCPPLAAAPTLGSVAGFMGALVTTMQTWQDQMQLVMPGFRDRIVHVSHSAQEGGLNLNMDPKIIAVLADSGIQAANELIRAFAEGGGIANPNAWDNHRRIRVRSLLSLIQQGLEAIANGLGQASHPGWDEMVVNPDPPSYPFKPTQIAAGALTLLHALEALAKDFPSEQMPLSAGAPKPSPQLRVSPRI